MFKKILISIGFLLLCTPVFATPVDVNGSTSQINNSGDMWDDFQYGKPGVYANYWNEFYTYAAGDWTITTTESGTVDATEALADSAGGVLRLTNDNSASGESDSLQLGAESFLPQSARNIYCESSVKVGGATTGDYLFGLVVTDTTPLSHANGIVFRKDTGDTQWDFATTSGSTTSSDTNIATAQTTDYIKVGFKVTGTHLVEYWVDGVRKGSFSTNIPTTEMRPTLYIGGQSVTMDVQNILCSQQLATQ